MKYLLLSALFLVGCADFTSNGISNPEAEYCFQTSLGRYEINDCSEIHSVDLSKACKLMVLNPSLKNMKVPHYCNEDESCNPWTIKRCENWND